MLGRPKKVTDNLCEAIHSMTKNNPRMSCNDISEIIRNDSMPDRLQAVLNNNGMHSGY